jgi:methylated-DNA-protein-cysteine methyltransferase-like protein
MLSGKHHFETPTLMQELLESEGIVVKDDTIQDFPTVFWDPAGNKKKPAPSAVKKIKKS